MLDADALLGELAHSDDARAEAAHGILLWMRDRLWKLTPTAMAPCAGGEADALAGLTLLAELGVVETGASHAVDDAPDGRWWRASQAFAAGAAPSPDARPSQAHAPGWRGMETAPRTGEPVILQCEGEKGVLIQTIGWWDPEFHLSYDVEAEQTVRRGAWTDGTVADWGQEERNELKPIAWHPLLPFSSLDHPSGPAPAPDKDRAARIDEELTPIVDAAKQAFAASEGVAACGAIGKGERGPQADTLRMDWLERQGHVEAGRTFPFWGPNPAVVLRTALVGDTGRNLIRVLVDNQISMDEAERRIAD